MVTTNAQLRQHPADAVTYIICLLLAVSIPLEQLPLVKSVQQQCAQQGPSCRRLCVVTVQQAAALWTARLK